MKGLLLKDFYLLIKYCKLYLFLPIFIGGLSFLKGVGGDKVSFVILYPCLFASMIPINLLSLDERSGWEFYGKTLPCKSWMPVVSKYLFGLFGQVALLLLSLLIEALRVQIQGTSDGAIPFGMIAVFSVFLLLPASLFYPFLFRFGTEKGRLISLVLTIFLVAAATFLLNSSSRVLSGIASISGFVPLLCAGVVLLYLLSILLSIVLYRIRKA